MPLILRFRLPIGATGRPAHGRLGVALEIAGDDSAITDGDPGRIKLFEVTERNAAAEEQEPRLLAIFQGTWHRRPGQRADTFAVTFEIGAAPDERIPPEPAWEVRGFEPECLPFVGGDYFLLFFLNRKFPICFPFFVASNEGDHLEIQAFAEYGLESSPSKLEHPSQVLNLPIRRNGEVQTTDGSRYTDELVGCAVLYHRHYLARGIRKLHTAEWHAESISTLLPIPHPNPTPDPRRQESSNFQSYAALPADQKIRVVLREELFRELFHHHQNAWWTAPALASLPTRDEVIRHLIPIARNAAVNLIRDRLIDAGFTDPQILIREQLDASHALSDLYDKASRLEHVTITFFTFFVVSSPSLSTVGRGEATDAEGVPTQTLMVEGQEWDYWLPTSFPIGGGTKRVTAPIRVRAAFFRDVATPPLPRDQTTQLAMSEFERTITKAAQTIGTIILHEIAHSLGMMHECLVVSSASSTGSEAHEERLAAFIPSIMCSSAESSPADAQPFFSNQCKIIWQECFGLSPNFPTAPLRNRSWATGTWVSTDWSARNRPLFAQRISGGLGTISRDAGVRNPYARRNAEDPFADGHTPNPQSGNFRP
ncbi:hypothetical protein WME90_24385 [Sorangium sp. So ce375]|uniref:hypothetical protein n=1 Tax=Sorangium sp. So ce375 TaxID=3133306 RepID=UPI003F5BED29